MNELFGLLRENNLSLLQSPISSSHLGDLLDLIESGYVSNIIAKDVLVLMSENGNRHPKDIIDERGLGQSSDTGELQAMCKQVIEESPKEVWIDGWMNENMIIRIVDIESSYGMTMLKMKLFPIISTGSSVFARTR